MKGVSPCLWFDGKADEASRFYRSVFPGSKPGATAFVGKAAARTAGLKEGNVLVTDFFLEDIMVTALNGGPGFKFSPAFSFFVSCSTEEEIESLWRKLSYGGQVRMGLDKYPWSEKYGWTADKFGFDWQLMLSPRPHKIVPAFFFANELFGRGEEAIKFYQSIFPNSRIENIAYDPKTKTVMHASFTLNGQGFALMDAPGEHDAPFSYATSLMVNCETQAEIDHYWNELSKGGSTEQCGWLKDKFGVSWQIVPANVRELNSNPATAEKSMSAVFKMTKLDLATINAAAAK